MREERNKDGFTYKNRKEIKKVHERNLIKGRVGSSKRKTE